MLEKFLSQLGASTKITVGVSVSPNVGLEMIEVDKPSGVVNKYSNKPLDYNSSTREIADYEEFAKALEELFEDLDIPKRSNIVLSLPNVYFGLINLPLLLTDEAITNAIISEVEQSYIFKRQEPAISWIDLSTNTTTENRLIAYTAIQKQAIDQIQEICDEIGCTLSCIETSFSSLTRTLQYLELTKEQMKTGVSWNLMVIMQNNYSILSMSGKGVLDYYEEPLALKSFIDDEIYNAIKTSAQLTLAGLPANYLYIASETDLVSAEVLSLKMPFEGTINFLECNKFSQNELMPINLNILPNKAYQITPEAIGTAVCPFFESPLKMNLLKQQSDDSTSSDVMTESPKINIGNLEVELTPAFIKKISLIISCVTIVPLFAIFMWLNNALIPQEQEKLNSINSRIESLNNDIKRQQEQSKGPSFDIYSTITKYVGLNKTKLTYYSALGEAVPKTLWINYYATSNDGKILIKGASQNVKDIYSFYKNIKQMVNDSDITLRKLEVGSGSIDDIIQGNNGNKKIYEYEIANMNESELTGAQPTGTDPNQAPQDPNAQPQQQGQPSGTPTPAPAPAATGFSFDPNKPFFTQKSNILGSPQGENKPTESPQPPMPPQPGGEQLPANLKKIEKF